MSRPTKIVLTKIIISVALIFYLFFIRRIDIRQVLQSLKHADVFWTIAAVTSLLLGRIITAYRWQFLLSAQKIYSSIKTLLTSLFVANFFNLFLPSTIGGDAIRAYDISRESRRPGTSVMTIVIERMMGGFALLVIALVSLVFIYFVQRSFWEKYNISDWVWPVIGLFGCMLIGYFIVSSNRLWNGLVKMLEHIKLTRLAEKVKKTGDILIALESKPKNFHISILLSFALQINVILYHYIMALALHLPIPFIYFCLIVPLIFLVLLFPFSINGIGIRESAFLFFFHNFVSSPQAIAFSWLQFFTTLFLGAVGGLVYVARKGPVSEKSE